MSYKDECEKLYPHYWQSFFSSTGPVQYEQIAHEYKSLQAFGRSKEIKDSRGFRKDRQVASYVSWTMCF